MITREKIVTFREDFKDAVENLEKTYGLKITLGTIRFSETDFRTTLEAFATDAPVKVIDESRLGLGSDAPKIGATFRFKTHRFTVSGYNMKRWKKPVKLTRDDGKSMIATVEFVKSCLK